MTQYYHDFSGIQLRLFNIDSPVETRDGSIYDHINISLGHRYLTVPSLHGAHSALDTHNLAHQRAMPLL